MLGESAGRSRNNPVKPGARRRFTADERAARTHAPDDPEAWSNAKPRREPDIKLTRRGWVVLGVAFVVAVVVVSMLTRDLCWTGQLPFMYGRCSAF